MVQTGGTSDARPVTIHNGRLAKAPFVLERNGFRFIDHDPKVVDMIRK